jgi:peptidoglycan/LPS O-acetylase OafA/YrhL
MSANAESARIGALDGLRGVAIVLVLLFHGGHLVGGFLGVDLFFVLSGYLITSLLLTEVHRNGGIALGAFWARRARRLLPALGLLLIGVGIASALWADPTSLGRIRADAIATTGYVANWHAIWSGRSYFDLFASPSPLDHTWSLAIEEQFYLLWPLIVLAAVRIFGRRRLPATILTLAAIGAVGSAFLMWVLYDPRNTSRAYYGTDTRASALFIGIALAAAVAGWGHVRGRFGRTALESGALLGLLGLGLVVMRWSGTTERLYHGGFLVTATAMALLVASATNPVRGPIARILAVAPLRWLGLISYGLYLWHWPVDVFLDGDRVGLAGWPLFAVDTAVAVGIAAASYHLVELPIRHGAFTRRTWTWLAPATLAAVLTAVALGTAGAAPPGFASVDHRLGRPGGILVVGDSVAESLGPGIAGLGYATTNRAIEGCRLLDGHIDGPTLLPDRCPWRKAWRQAVRQARPRVVVLVQGGFALANVIPPGAADYIAPGSVEWARRYRATLEDAVRLLGADGARVVVPRIACLDPAGTSRTNVAAGLLARYDPARVRAANAVIDGVAAAHPRVVAPDLFGFLCPTGSYRTAAHGVSPVRVDGVHFGPEGAALVARFLSPELAGAARAVATP